MSHERGIQPLSHLIFRPHAAVNAWSQLTLPQKATMSDQNPETTEAANKADFNALSPQGSSFVTDFRHNP